jgi:phage gp36-like protein
MSVMPYATTQDMIDEFGQRELQAIGDPDGTGEIDTVRVENALARASEQIDFAAGQRCALPLTISSPSVATFLKQLCLDIARYRLTGSSGVTATDEVRDRYKEADAKLQQIIAGKIILCEMDQNGETGGGGLQPGKLSAGEASADHGERVFNGRIYRDYMGSIR